jgi:glucose-6-phosphate isomerase
VPGTDYTFGRLIAAQAEGDYRALSERGRPIIRVSDLDDVLTLM